MMGSIRAGLFYYIAGGLLVTAWIMAWYLRNPQATQGLRDVAWAIWILGIILIFLSRSTLKGRGGAKKGGDWTQTSILVNTGLYRVIRHPLYLGWVLMYIGIFFYSQHWLTIAVGVPGIVCVTIVSKQEDQRLIKKFGPDYEEYMRSVPAMNVFSGLFRLVSRRKSKD